jgi:hypothetical protein
MSIYLLQNQQQTGPYTESQVQHLLQAAVVAGSTLAWKEGMAAWAPISTLVSTQAASFAPGYPPPPPGRKSPLGLASFVVSLISAPLWLILFVIAGIAHNAGNATEGFNMIVGFVAIAGIFVNFAGTVMGLVAAFKGKPNTLAIIGAALNGFMVIGILGMIALGIAVQHGHSSS